MDTSTPSELANGPLHVGKPLIVFAMPFIVLFPYWWFLYHYLPERGAASKVLGADHMRVHYGVFWVLTFFPFTGICFLSSTIMLVRRARRSEAARVALVPVGFFLLGIIVLIALILSDFVR
jgi:cytochrome bd-type quinol oxidase subunit 2